MKGITGWPEGAAHEAAERCFQRLAQGPGRGESRRRSGSLLAQVRLFFEQHSNRFRWKDRAFDDRTPPRWRSKRVGRTPPRASWGASSTTPFRETFRAEIVAGFDPTDAARVLARRDCCNPAKTGGRVKRSASRGIATPSAFTSS